MNTDQVDDPTWQTIPIRVRGGEVLVAHRPGLPGAGPADIAHLLLAEHVQVERSDAVIVLNGGAGLVGVVALGLTTGSVDLADPHIVAVEAARRTAAANGCSELAVHHSHGTSHWQPGRPADIVAARLPKGHLPALQTIWDAWRLLRAGGRLYLAGANAEGIQSYLRHMGDLFGRCATLAYRKGHRVGVAVKEEGRTVPPAFQEEWLDHARFRRFDVIVRGKPYAVCSRPGVFSWDRLDRGTEALLAAMQIAPGDTVLDLGCGYGIIGVVAAEAAGQVYLVDADIAAVESARRTVALHGLHNCQVLPGDGAAAIGEVAFDVVVTNPPFHQGKATTYDVARQFIRDAGRMLRPGGRFYLVANRFLPYEDAIREVLGTVEMVYSDSRYKVLSGSRSAATS
jgi:16S rRNA (guanine1207-N2)-methyltransferase